jgi:hypothetical protein
MIKYWRFDIISLSKTIISSISRFLSGLPSSEELFQYGFPYEPSLLDIWLNRIYLLFIGPYAVLILALIYFAPILSIEKKRLTTLTLALLSVSAFESIPYAIVTGGINLRYLSLFVPVTTMSITGMLASYKKSANIKRIIFYILLILLIVATASSAKLNYINGAVNGLGANKKELTQHPEYTILAIYAPPQTSIYSNFQVSGELRLSSIKMGTDQYMLCIPFRKTIYNFYEAVEEHNLEKLSGLLNRPSIIVLTNSDFGKPMYGDAWGYAVPSLGEQTKKWLENSTLDLVYNSGRLEAFHIK